MQKQTTTVILSHSKETASDENRYFFRSGQRAPHIQAAQAASFLT